MPTNLSDVSTFTSPVAVPADGDARNAASVQTPFQALANRTKWLYDKITNGVPRVQFYSSTAALANVTGQVNGDVAIVNGTYLGVYIYDTGVSGADLSPWFVKPTGFLDGASGRWKHLFYSFGVNASAIYNENRWIIPPANHLPAAPSFATSNSGTVTMTGSYQDVGPSVTINSLLVGDVLVIDGDMGFDPNGSSNTATVGIKVSGENSDNVFSDSEVAIVATSPAYRVHTQLVCTLAAAGNKTIQMRARDSGIVSGANQIKPRYMLRAFVIRPLRAAQESTYSVSRGEQCAAA